MAITKTKFINYVRCKRFVALDDLNKEKLDSDISYKNYKEEEQMYLTNSLLEEMYDEEDNDLLTVVDEQLEVMLPYYNEIEILAGNVAQKYFNGNFKFAYKTVDQESFDCVIKGIRYLCYIDIYNEDNENVNIIEVKATSTKKFLSIGSKEQSIFMKNEKGIFVLLEELNIDIEEYMTIDKYNKEKMKLFNKFNSAGRYVYDLAVQRYIIENDLNQNNINHQVKYYLAVLNGDYVFDGTYVDGFPVYNQNNEGNEIVSFFDMTKITKQYMDVIDVDRKKVERYMKELDGSVCPIGDWCEHKKTTKCRYVEICFNKLPEKNSLFHYLDSHHGFKDEDGNKYNRWDLINDGVVGMLDVPTNYLNRNKNVIQRNVIETHKPYVNLDKIKDGIAQIKYPIYHLDFETFPCPLPRFKGETPYTQSVFQFSLHIEREKGICDKTKDHYEFLAPNHNDNREELIKKMLEYIDVNNEGTVLVYNESFEKTRLKELGNIFPFYKNDLNKLKDMVFDLMNITKTKSTLYEELGYSKEESSLFNYYHEDMLGSFSIKKFLPLFSNLSYKGMEVSNGIDALVTYAKFSKMDEIEFKHKYQKLVEYCCQDTWAMVEILWGLNKLVN